MEGAGGNVTFAREDSARVRACAEMERLTRIIISPDRDSSPRNAEESSAFFSRHTSDTSPTRPPSRPATQSLHCPNGIRFPAPTSHPLPFHTISVKSEFPVRTRSLLPISNLGHHLGDTSFCTGPRVPSLSVSVSLGFSSAFRSINMAT